jgi:hypothetical protein
MIIKGKEIKSETITMWLNVLSFIVGFIFYIRLEQRSKHELQVIPTQPIHDSVLVIDTELHSAVNQLKVSQDSLITELRINQQHQLQTKKNVAVIRHQLFTNIQSDWDSLNQEQQNAYINQLKSNLKNKTTK